MKTEHMLHPQYITDQDGNRIGVILPVAEYGELLEDLDDLATAAERIQEPVIPHEKVLAELKTDEHISD